MDVLLISYTMGAAISIGLAATGAGLGIGYTGAKACEAIAKQPSAASDILKIMLISQAVTESSAIFALVVSLLLIFTYPGTATMPTFVAFIASGICMGAGAIGPGFGAGYVGAKACEGVGRIPQKQTNLLVNMLIG